MVPEFEEAVYSLANAGDVSEPVVSDFGVHLIRLDNIVAEEGAAFDRLAGHRHRLRAGFIKSRCLAGRVQHRCARRRTEF